MLENAQVFRICRLRDYGPVGQHRHGLFAVAAQPLEDGAAGRVGQGAEKLVRRGTPAGYELASRRCRVGRDGSPRASSVQQPMGDYAQIRLRDSFWYQVARPATGGPNRVAALACALDASVWRSRGGAFVTSESSNSRAALATSSTARLNAGWFALEGRVKPLNLRTNCKEDARISSSVAGGLKLWSVFMLRHTTILAT
jgi:hypothetical protein